MNKMLAIPALAISFTFLKISANAQNVNYKTLYDSYPATDVQICDDYGLCIPINDDTQGTMPIKNKLFCLQVTTPSSTNHNMITATSNADVTLIYTVDMYYHANINLTNATLGKQEPKACPIYG
jgi:hypothetical protein